VSAPDCPTTATTDEVITLAELCARLKLERHTVAAQVREGHIPAWCPSKRVLRFHWPSVVQALFTSPPKPA
jgi:hypothetical protein